MSATFAGFCTTELIYESRHSCVYRCVRDADGQPVIIKQLKKGALTPEELNRFRREFDIGSDLYDTGVVPKYFSLKKEHGFLMEIEDFGGESLRNLWHDCRPDLPTFLSVARQAATALDNLHRRHVIHKNISPGNLIYNIETDVLKVIDFGIAGLVRCETRYLDNPSNLEGIPAYMSPEQTGRINRVVDYRTDFYSLGATFYQLLCGRLPFEEADPLAMIHCHIARTPIPPHDAAPEIPVVLSKIVMRMMAKHAEDRYRSARGLWEDLQRCATLIQEGETAPEFPLGEKDFSPQFALSPKIYGRDKELALLRGAFQDARSGTVVVQLTGWSGVGKTVLVQELFKPLTESGGLFGRGKFDQFLHGTPCSAFVEALKELTRRLICLSEAELEEWRQELRVAVTNNGRIITDLIPEMETIIGTQPDLEEVDTGSMRHRVLQTLSRVIGVFCKPLVLFIDDLQWADAQSLALIEWLAVDGGNVPLLLIAAYRNNEVSEDHPLTAIWKRLSRESTNHHRLILKPLTLEDSGLMIADSLRLPESEITGLRDLVFAKTGGNPFFLGRFLEELYEQEMLFLEPETLRWTWDEVAIHAMDFSENLVDLMVERLRRHREETCHALRLAACLGSFFSLSSLSLVLDMPPKATFKALFPALQDGLLIPLSSLEIFSEEDEALVIKEFKFSHGRIQQAARQLIEPSQLPKVQHHIGYILATQLPEESLHLVLLEVADLLNKDRGSIESRNGELLVADMNFKAGQRALDGAAYDMAMEYFTAATEHLPPDTWEQDPEKALAYHRARARAAAAVGYNGEATALLTQLLGRVEDNAISVSLHRELGHVYQLEGNYQAAMDQVRLGLACLGICIPENVRCHVESLEDRVNQILMRTPWEAMIPIEDDWGKTVLQFLGVSMGAAYMLDWHLFRYLNAKCLVLTLELGYSLETILATGAYAAVLKTNGRYEESLRIGRWTERIREREGFPTGPNPGYWLGMTAQEMEHSCHQSIASLLNSGRFYQANMLRFSDCTVKFMLGKQSDYRNQVDEYLAFAHKYNAVLAETVLTGLKFAWANLTVPRPGEAFGCPEERHFEENLPNFCKCIYLTNKAEVLMINGRLAAAAVAAGQAHLDLKSTQGTGYYENHQWIYAVVLAMNAGGMEPEERAGVRRELEEIHQKWQQLAALNIHFFGYQEALLRAEIARLDHRLLEALNALKQAADLAHRHEFVRHEALIEDRLADLWQAMGYEEYSELHLSRAYQGYRLLKIQAKIGALEARLGISALLQEPAGFQRTLHSVDHSAEALDLQTVIKAGQAISGNLDLAELLTKMMAIVIESAGAELGRLFLQENDRWVIRAMGNAHESHFLEEGIPLQMCEDVCWGAVQQVSRTGDPLVLDNAFRSGYFHADGTEARSLMCLPVLAAGRKRCLLYLENNLNTAVFTSRHLNVLNTLTAQMAISLENAILYTDLAEHSRTLEQKVASRTQELREKNQELEAKNQEIVQTQQQLVTKEKMASLGTLTAGVAHEINNPTNFVYGGAQNLEARLTAFRRYLMAMAEDAPEEVQQDLENRMAPLFQDCRLIQEGTHRINHIVRDLRMFTRKDEMPGKLTSLSEAVAATLNLIQAGYRDRIAFRTHFLDPLLVPCHGAEMNQVFMNIIVNACDAVDEQFGRDNTRGNGVIEITTSVLGDEARIEVRDNGCGMSPEIRSKIFEPFFTTKGVGEGTGLGLSISYGIIKKHHGKIDVSSTQGEGSTFTLRLPMNLAN